MSRQLVRVSLVIITLVVVVTSLYRVFLIEQQIAADRDTESVFSVTAWELGLALGDLRAAQQAYVAIGQDRAYWVEKVSLHFARITTDLAQLAGLSMTPGGGNAIAETAAAVETLGQLDTLAREYSAMGHDLMASDLIFADGLKLATVATGQLKIARDGERDAQNRQRQQHRRSELIALGVAMGTTLLTTLLLLPTVRVKAAPDGASQLEPEVVRTDADSEVAQPPFGTIGNTGLDSPGDGLVIGDSPPEVFTPNLRQAATLCTDLGQLHDTTELPQTLKRAADLLQASGLIIWVRDESGVALRPAAGHGYSPNALLQIGTIPCDGDNMTVEAYRSAQLQAVPGSAEAPGAIAAPLLTPGGCIGVMSAELREVSVMSEAVQAMTLILAAQLSTLVSADPQAEAGRAQA